MPIKVLPPEIVSQIAAGEVVERPASVVKELVETSLDAAAREISVETGGGGVSLLRVTDNGVGIPPGELELAFQRYATSKIARLDDLDSIASLGFRGEALPSIAAVAQVDIASCARGESSGSYCRFREGGVIDRGSQGHAPGTTVTVRELFRNIPARLKFLKSPTTENSHIAEVVSHYALGFPEVRFTLSVDGRTVLRTPGSGRLLDSAIEVYGLEVARNLLEVNGENSGWEGGAAVSAPRVTGLTSSPAVNRSHRGYLSFFVNRRWISSRMLAWAVEEAYHGLLMVGKYPIAIINISLPPREVDANIHPAKTEVRFQDERLVFGAVQKAVRRTLLALAPVPRIEEVTTAYREPAASGQRWSLSLGGEPGTTVLPIMPQSTPAFSLPALRLLGQMASSYLVAEGPDGLYLIDQHAAHECILFEQVKQQMARRAIEVQGLLEPATLEVSPQEDAGLKARCESLAEGGFSLEPFGERTYLVRAVPLLLHLKDWRGALKELLAAPAGDNDNDWREKMAASIACHSAVRAGQQLTDDEMRGLLRQLEQVALPNTCPHGRPTMIHLGSRQLEREFGRS